MTISLRQSAAASGGPGVQTAKATFGEPTVPGSLIFISAAVTHQGDEGTTLTGPAGATLIRKTKRDELTVAAWYIENASAMTSVQVSSSAKRSIQIRVLELRGIAQSGALDRQVGSSGYSKTPNTGTSSTTTQADELVLAVLGNRYTSSQSGFTGGLGVLSNTTSPTDADDHRTRMTVHGGIASAVGAFKVAANLSASRDWVGILATFKAGTAGPARMTSTTAPAMLVTDGGTGALTVFGPLVSTDLAAITPYLDTAGKGSARVGPFEYQYRLNGWTGLLIGHDTPWRVESHEGLEGWDLRTSDDDLPRGDGAQRGVDLQSARQILFRVNVDGTRTQVEQRLEELYRALVPQRDEDWELIWRHPGRPLRLLRCRPISLVRELNQRQALLADQSFALRAADPRHYSAVLREIQVPVAPAGAAVVPVVSAVNAGNARAYPLIRIVGAPDVDVTRVTLVNATADVRFDVEGILPPRATLVGDMPARVTAAPRSVITLDGQSKYGSWQFPRDAFYLAPAPDVGGGANALYVATEPPGAGVTCTVEWRDTYAG